MQKPQTKPRLVMGHGVNDADYAVMTTGEGGKRQMCPFYRAWKNMLMRVYSPAYHARCPTYTGATICSEWLVFSTFKAWMETQDWEGKHLDKDIMVPGNKDYSPSRCVFASHAINNLLNGRGAARGEHPIGVCFHKRRKKYRAGLSISGRTKHIGRFDTPAAAARAYSAAKATHVRKIAREQIDVRIVRGLLRHAALIEAQ